MAGEQKLHALHEKLGARGAQRGDHGEEETAELGVRQQQRSAAEGSQLAGQQRLKKEERESQYCENPQIESLAAFQQTTLSGNPEGAILERQSNTSSASWKRTSANDKGPFEPQGQTQGLLSGAANAQWKLAGQEEHEKEGV